MTGFPQGHDRSQGGLNPKPKRMFRKIGLRLLRRLLLYHVAIAAALVLAAMLFPGFAAHLPVGGVSTLVAGEAAVMAVVEAPRVQEQSSQPNPVLKAGNDFDRLGYARQLVIVLVGVWLLMLPISWVHKGIHGFSTYDHSLDETVLILPGTVAAIVLVVQHSLALAFSLAGIVAGVQFRRALQDTFDALFILVAIGVGIAAGVRALEIAAVLTVFFCYATLYVYYLGDGFESDFLAREKQKKQLRKRAKNEADANGDGE